MRKSFLTLAAALLFLMSHAQVSYTFNAITGTYTSLSAAAIKPGLDSATTLFPGSDEGFANNISIGFSFKYNGVSYVTLHINSNGFVSFGNPFIVDDNEDYQVPQLPDGPSIYSATRPIIAPFWADIDLLSNNNLSYIISGNNPNRIFTVQWNKALYDYNATAPCISFQLKLYETTNVIEFIYKKEAGTPTGTSASIGLSAAGKGLYNFMALTDTTASPGITSTDVDVFLNGRPATGQIYRFTPLPCAPPVINAAIRTGTTATVSWSIVAGAVGYEYITSDSLLVPSVSGIATTNTSISFTNLGTGIKYIYIRTSCGGGAYSLWTRKVLIPCTTNILPANGATGQHVPPFLTWNKVSGARGYLIMRSTDNIHFATGGTIIGPDSINYWTNGFQNMQPLTTYYFYIRAFADNDTASLSCSLANATSFTTEAAPANDSICHAINLTLNGPYVCGSSFTSGVEPNEPSPSCSQPPYKTVWYKFTAGNNKRVKITMKKVSDDPSAGISLYQASGSCPNLTLTELPNSCSYINLTANDSDAVLTDTLTAGITYYIMIDASYSGGNFCIRLSNAPSIVNTCPALLLPANNDTTLSGPIVHLKWRSVPNATSYGIVLDVSYPPSYIPYIVTTDTTYTLSGYNVGVPPDLKIYWTIIPYTYNLSPATVCSADSFTTGSMPPAPPNDECTGAISLAPGVAMQGTCVSATESLPPHICNNFAGTAYEDVWYKITALQPGSATITVTPEIGMNARIEAFTGNCTSLTSIACADTAGSGGTEVLKLNNMAAGQLIYLRVHNSDDDLSSPGTFTIIAGGIALPVTCTSFSGQRNGTVNVLHWATATEQNNRGFELQRSIDGKIFSGQAFIASKAAEGYSTALLSYRFTDEKPLAGNCYYRLKQIDFDGRNSYSNIVFLKGTAKEPLVISSIYPDPVRSDLNIAVTASSVQKINIVITDLTGKMMIQQPAEVVSGDNHFLINVSRLAAGVYVIKAACTNGCETALRKFAKQRG